MEKIRPRGSLLIVGLGAFALVLGGALALAMVAAAHSAGSADASDAERMRADIALMRAEIVALRTDVRDLRDKSKALERQVSEFKVFKPKLVPLSEDAPKR